LNVFDAATVTRWALVRKDERVGWRVDTVQGSKEKLLDKTNIDEEEKAWKSERRESEFVTVFLTESCVFHIVLNQWDYNYL